MPGTHAVAAASTASDNPNVAPSIHPAAALILLLLICARAESKAAAVPTLAKVRDFALLDHQGTFHHLYYYYAKDSATKAIVLFVRGNGCPLVRKRVPELKRLRDAYTAKGMVFWMLNANPDTCFLRRVTTMAFVGDDEVEGVDRDVERVGVVLALDAALPVCWAIGLRLRGLCAV